MEKWVGPFLTTVKTEMVDVVVVSESGQPFFPPWSVEVESDTDRALITFHAGRYFFAFLGGVRSARTTYYLQIIVMMHGQF